MRTLFVTVINMSYTASFVIASVLILRLLMRRLPKLFTNLLWVMVLVRLLCPISFETLWSVLPSGQLLPTDLDQLNPFEIHSGIAAIDLPVNEALLRSDYEGASKVVSILAAVWLCGVAATMTIGIVKACENADR